MTPNEMMSIVYAALLISCAVLVVFWSFLPPVLLEAQGKPSVFMRGYRYEHLDLLIAVLIYFRRRQWVPFLYGKRYDRTSNNWKKLGRKWSVYLLAGVLTAPLFPLFLPCGIGHWLVIYDL